ncbi:MAG: TetR/AcrR family transcriptional regulator [Acidobacteria bacterium]|nr:TetR/AcrR family transcriptional regulator [Acidobacteriota bacterium]
MGTSRRKLKAERKRREILRAAAGAFKKRGFYGTTMEDISSELLMTQGSLYYYFKSKEEILFACHEHSLAEMLDVLDRVRNVDAAAPAKLHALIEAHVAIMIDDLAASAMALEFTALSEPYLSQIIAMRDRYEQGLRDIIRSGIDAGEFLPANPRLTGFAILGAINWIARWFRSQGPLAAEAVGRQFADLFLRSLGVDPGSVQDLFPGHGSGSPLGGR